MTHKPEGASVQPGLPVGQLIQNETIARAGIRVRRSLWLYSALLLSTTAWAWIVYTRHPFPDYRPLLRLADRFTDLTLYRDKIAHLSNGASGLAQGLPSYNYPAPAAYVFAFFFAFGDHAVRAYLLFVGLCAAGFGLVSWRATMDGTRQRLAATVAIWVTALIGFPLWFVADRANLEVVVWALASLGLGFLLRRRYVPAAILLGMASAIKPFPALFFLLLLRRGKFRETVLGAVVAGGLILAALIGLGPNPVQAYRQLQPGVERYIAAQGAALGHPEEARFEHSLLDGMKSAALLIEMRGLHPAGAVSTSYRLLEIPGGWKPPQILFRFYPIITLISLCALVAIFFKMPMLNQLTAAGVAVTLLPPVSADYTLLHLYVPFAAFVVFLVREVATGRAEFPSTSMNWLMAIYALLFAPLTFLRIFAGDAKLLLLLSLLYFTAKSPMRSVYFGDTRLATDLQHS